MGVVLLSCITGNAITKAWGTNSSTQNLATSATQVRCNAASGWAACSTTTTGPLPELKIPEREFAGS
jgi:hypothetical protein